MSRVNHNANYIFDVEGETVWEKLRVIRNMLSDRERTYQLSLIRQEKSQKEVKKLKKESYEYREYMVNKDFSLSLVEDCKNEVEFLKKYEAWLAAEAEKTRIPGKTDDEMYELNFFEELKTRLVRRAQAQVISTGRIQEETLLRIMKNSQALESCIQQNLLPKNIVNLVDTPLLADARVHTDSYALLTNREEDDGQTRPTII